MKIDIIYDRLNNPYIGIKVSKWNIFWYLKYFKHILDGELYMNNQQKRDNGEYHITIFNVAETNKLVKDGIRLDSLIGKYITDIKYSGIGTLGDAKENTTYYISLTSKQLERLHPKQDFHITIGFNNKDVFKGRKFPNLINATSGFDILKQYLYKLHERILFSTLGDE